MLCFFTSCSNTKYLPKGETLYIGSKIKYVSSDSSAKSQKAVLKDELKAIILPKPNMSILGLRIKLWFYNIAGRPTGKGLRYLIRNKLGEPPVYASSVNFEKNRNIMTNRLENRGYFKGMVNFDTTTKNKRTSAVFTAKPGLQYTIDTVNFPKDSSELSMAIRTTTRRSSLRTGRAYDLDLIKAERTRIDARLKQKGYFFFNENYLLLKVDSTVGSNKVNTYMVVKPETPPQAKYPYRIGDVIIYADYNLNSDTAFSKQKAVFYDSFYVVDPYKKFNPRMYRRNIRFHPGDLYNRNDHNLTLSRLVSLGVYKFVKARFEEVDTVKDRRLNAYYYLSPNNKYSAKAQVSALSKSNNSSGTDFTLSLKNRNAFRSAEQLSISGFLGLETQIAGQQNVGTTRYGGDLDLLIPRIIPHIGFGRNSDFVPKTRINLGYEYFRRTDQYTLNSFKSSFGWVWNTSIATEHQFNPIALNYVLPSSITTQFKKGLDTNITLARSIEKQFIIGSNYNYNYNSQAKPNNKRHNFYFNGNADFSGNILGLITGADVENGKEKKIFGTPFSQYLRGELDFRHYMAIGKPRRIRINQLVNRVIIGAGYGYGNSVTMPFIKQFFIGGTNSIRAYRARSLGPGIYYAGNLANDSLRNRYLPDQPGDVKIEINTELRFKIASIVRGAFFVDAGNIFTMRTDPARPGSKFSKDFFSQLAVGTGAGLRFDLNFLVLRIDAAFPIRKPYEDGGPKWVIDKVAFGDSQWRKENFVLNLAIGYPF
ncbi:MAG: BamA/TamA family outer membrane protein [Ferruginibacter sp.]|nr:BamA/TamA family outer membrane protein [Ferruginibacter sp.]